MTFSKEFMKNYKKINPVDVHLADDGVVQAVGTGDIIKSMKAPRGVKRGLFTSVWYIPKLSRNLFCVGVSPRMLDRSRSSNMGASLK